MTDFATRRMMMVDTQVRPSDVTKFPIIDAMLSVQREAFVPEGKRAVAYVGETLDIGEGRFMLEARIFAKMLDALALGQDDLVLDLGCGYGYSSAVLARMCEAVVAVEPSEDLAADAQSILSEQGVDNVAVMAGDLAAGVPKHGPYDAITVQGGVETMPKALLDQLKEGGRIAAIFMNGALGECRIGYKQGNTCTWRLMFNAAAPVLDGFQARKDFEL